jgi:hypothetical protein
MREGVALEAGLLLQPYGWEMNTPCYNDPMDSLYTFLWIALILLPLGGGVLLFALWRLYRPTRTVSTLPYAPIPLLTAAEKKFFAALEQAVPEGCYVLAQVRLANLVQVKPGTPEFWKHFTKIGMKTVDFVVVRRETMTPVLVVELDDKSHDKADRRERDKFVNEVLASISLPIMRWPALSSYNMGELTQVLRQKMNL